MFKALLTALLLGSALVAQAGVVTLTDGSSVSGELKEQQNGDVIVVTGAGEITVKKDKIRSVVQDGSATSKPDGDFSYIDAVNARRAKYGNEDGIPRSSMVNGRQVAFSIGMLNYLGDGFDNPLTKSSDFNSLYYGMSVANNFNDLVGWELWGGYGIGEKNYGSGVKASVQRADLAFMPRIQKAISLGAPEQQIHLIPHLGIGPVYSYITSGIDLGAFGGRETVCGSSVGAALSVGADLQLGPALIGVKYRYLMSSDTSGHFNSRNMSAGIPQLSVGWAF